MADPQTLTEIARQNAILAADPQYQQILAANHAGGRQGGGKNMGDVQVAGALRQRAAELGVSETTIPQGYAIDPANGQVVVNHGIRNAIIGLAAVASGGLAAGALAGGAAAASGVAGGGVGASAALPSTVAASTGSSLLPKLIKGAESIGPALGKMEANRAAGRTAEDTANLNYDQNNIARSIAAGNDYQRNTWNALRGGLLQGAQDSTITAPPGIRMGTITGGLRPSAILGKEDLGKQLQVQAMKNLLASDQSGATTTPAMTARPNANGFDTGLNIAAPLLSLGQLLAKQDYSAKPVTPNPVNPAFTIPKLNFGIGTGY